MKKETEDLEQRLLELGEGASLEELLSEAESVNSDSLPVLISELSHWIEELEQERSKLDQKIGSHQMVLFPHILFGWVLLPWNLIYRMVQWQ